MRERGRPDLVFDNLAVPENGRMVSCDGGSWVGGSLGAVYVMSILIAAHANKALQPFATRPEIFPKVLPHAVFAAPPLGALFDGVNELIIPSYKQTWAYVRNIVDAIEGMHQLKVSGR